MLKRKALTLCILILVTLFLYFEDNWIKVSKYHITATDIGKEIDGFKIVQISDLHNKLFGKDQARLVAKVKDEEPDIIVITGDLIDRRRYNEKNAIRLLEKVVKIAPVYYVTGNHEWWSGKYIDFKDRIEDTGVCVLSNEEERITYKNTCIHLIGLDDPARYTQENHLSEEGYKIFYNTMKELLSDVKENEFTILLSHRPELFDMYKTQNMDLMFCGHAHGGQIRLPFVGGLYAPHQGIFPKYDAGVYTYEQKHMIVSRGLGNSVFPIRILNRPEIVAVTVN